MKKISRLLFVLPAIACLSGCGEKVDPNTIEFWHTFGAKTLETLEKKATAFEQIMAEHGKDVNIHFTYQGGYDDINSKITKGFSAGNIPTIAVAYPDHVADYLQVNNGNNVYNLENYFEDSMIGFGTQDYLGEFESKDSFVDTFIDEGTHFTKAGTYTLPFMKSSEALFYNKDYLVRAYRLVNDDPDITEEAVINWINNVSWEDFIDFCSDVAPIMGQVSNLMEYVLAYDSDANLLISKMYQNQIPYSSIQNGVGQIDFKDSTAKGKLVSLVQNLSDLHTNKVLITKGYNKDKYGSDLFKNYQCLFTVGSTGGSGYNDPGAQFTPGVCKIPASNNNPVYISQGPTLTFLKNPKYDDSFNNNRMDIAWQFAKYLVSASVNTEMCVYGSEGYLPVSTDAYNTREFGEAMDGDALASLTYKVLINDVQGNYINTPVFPGSAKLRTEMEGILKSVLNGHKTAATAVEEAIVNTELSMH